jgi:hypothetical protein
MRRLATAVALLASAAAYGAEVGSFDDTGSLTAITHEGASVPVKARLVVRFAGGPEVELQPAGQASLPSREGNTLRWKGTTTAPNGAALDFEIGWLNSPERPGLDSHLGFTAKLYCAGPKALSVESADFVIDLPRALFAGGDFVASGDNPHRLLSPTPLPRAAPPGAKLLEGESRLLEFLDAGRNWDFVIDLQERLPFTLTDYGDGDDRSYRVRLRVSQGQWQPGSQVQMIMNLFLKGHADTGK